MPKPKDTHALTLYLPLELHSAIKQLAKHHERPVAWMIRYAIRNLVEAEPVPPTD